MPSLKVLRFQLLLSPILFLFFSTTAGAENSNTVAYLDTCPGAVIDNGPCEKYQIMNAIGDGLVIHEANLRVDQAKIFGASGNGISVTSAGGGVVLSNAVIQNVAGCGIVVRGDGCIIDGGSIDGARDIGLLVIGNRNNITDIKIRNCIRPIVIQGVGNIVSWSNNQPAPTNESVQVRDSKLQNIQSSNSDASGNSMSVEGQLRSKQP